MHVGVMPVRYALLVSERNLFYDSKALLQQSATAGCKEIIKVCFRSILDAIAASASVICRKLL